MTLRWGALEEWDEAVRHVRRDDNRIDWLGLSLRRLLGWYRGTQCLARCSGGHTFGRWCLLGPKRRQPGRRWAR